MQKIEQWTAKWLNSVVDGTAKMSQRKLTSIEKHGGGLKAVTPIATSKGIHLLLLEDEHGDKLVAASMKPFKVLC